MHCLQGQEVHPQSRAPVELLVLPFPMVEGVSKVESADNLELQGDSAPRPAAPQV